MNPRELFVQKTFDRIAERYDLLNRVISFHLDTAWRKRAIAELRLDRPGFVLDLGTGTGDLALTAAKILGPGGKVIGLDLSREMIRVAEVKKQREGLEDRIRYTVGNALSPPFKSASFDGIVTAFVLRNVSDMGVFFDNAYRLLKPAARLVCLEMFPPKRRVFSFFYSVYFYCLMPWIGAGLARNHEAYRYLAESVKNFCPPETVTTALERIGFCDVAVQKFLQGAVCLHSARKPASH